MNLDLEKIRSFGNIEFLAKQLVEGFITGLHKSPYHGFSVEFAEHKIYNQGESTRNIDWKVFARTDRLYTKKYEEETNLRCVMLIDNSPSMYYPEKNLGKITFSIMATAALTQMMQKQRDAVGFIKFSDKIEYQTPIKSTPSHGHKLFLLLEKMFGERPGQSTSEIAKTIHQVAEKVPQRALFIIFSDMFDSQNPDEILPALQHLKHNKHEVVLFHVTDHKTEAQLDYAQRPHLFIDAETNEKIKIQPELIKEKYQKEYKAYFDMLKLKCGQYLIDFIEADINKSFEQILLPYLVKRKKMLN